MSLSKLTSIGTVVKQALAMPTVNDLGPVTGQARRLRTVTPHRLFLAAVSALAARRVETLADLLRVFNHQQGVSRHYPDTLLRGVPPGGIVTSHGTDSASSRGYPACSSSGSSLNGIQTATCTTIRLPFSSRAGS